MASAGLPLLFHYSCLFTLINRARITLTVLKRILITMMYLSLSFLSQGVYSSIQLPARGTIVWSDFLEEAWWISYDRAGQVYCLAVSMASPRESTTVAPAASISRINFTPSPFV